MSSLTMYNICNGRRVNLIPVYVARYSNNGWDRAMVNTLFSQALALVRYWTNRARQIKSEKGQ